MASRDKVVVDMFHKSIQYALEKLGESKSGFERTVVSKFKRKRRVGSGNELVDYSRAPCLGADQRARGLWERDCFFTNGPRRTTSFPGSLFSASLGRWKKDLVAAGHPESGWQKNLMGGRDGRVFCLVDVTNFVRFKSSPSSR